MAHSFIKAGVYKKILVVSAEIQSVWQDLTTRGREAAPIFGDGAAAFVFCDSDDSSDILSCQLGSNGYTEPLSTLAYNSACGETWGRSDSDYRYIHPHMLGSKVFKYAVKGTIGLITDILENAQKTYNDVDWFVPHQANQNINAFVAGSLGSEVEVRKDDAPLIKDKRWLSNIEKYGNLSAASIPLLFHENIKNGKIKRGDLCAMAAYGAGFNWGAMLLKY